MSAGTSCHTGMLTTAPKITAWSVSFVLRALHEGKVKTLAGNDVPVRAQSVCVHSDTPGSVAVAKAVFGALRPARAAE